MIRLIKILINQSHHHKMGGRNIESILKFAFPRLKCLPALLSMTRKKGSSVKRTKSSESESDVEFGIYNVERIVAKKTDASVFQIN